MYSRESQKYIYSLIKKFADENSLEMEKAKEILKDEVRKSCYTIWRCSDY